jgi:SpoVK/Ycf46/Vps4 family AAA+-type ATPase
MAASTVRIYDPPHTGSERMTNAEEVLQQLQAIVLGYRPAPEVVAQVAADAARALRESEAEAARLREALREIEEQSDGYTSVKIARAALAPQGKE